MIGPARVGRIVGRPRARERDCAVVGRSGGDKATCCIFLLSFDPFYQAIFLPRNKPPQRWSLSLGPLILFSLESMEMYVRSHRFTAQQQQSLCRYTLTSETVKMSTQNERDCCTFTSAASSRGEILSSLLFLPSELGNPVSHSSFLPVSATAQRTAQWSRRFLRGALSLSLAHPNSS